MNQPALITVPVAECQGDDSDEIPSLATVLGQGPYATVLTASGTGFSSYRGQAVTRWVADPTRDAAGYFIYLRDLESQRYWSLSRQPTRRPPAKWSVRFFPGHVEFIRLEEEIESTLTVWVTDEGVEFRRCRLKNLASRTRHLELTSYLEFVLTSARADAAHPAFAKLFIETEFDQPRRAILARRRPREKDEVTICGVHFLAGHGATACELETDRKSFLGRGRDPSRPRALETREPLIGHVGPVLDPVGSLRQVVSLPSGQTAEMTFGLTAGTDVDAMWKVAEHWHADDRREASLTAATQSCSARWATWSLSPERQRSVLQKLGRAIFDPETLREPPGSSPPLALPEVSDWLTSAVRCVLAGPPSAAEPFPAAEEGDGPAVSRRATYQPATTAPTAHEGAPGAEEADLLFANGWGGFTPDGREYVIHIRRDAEGSLRLPPLPWSNVIANEQAGFIATETGAGYTWVGNSRLNRLTPWSNDPVSDPHGEAFYVRDESRGTFWSPTPGPVPGANDYEIRHGFGYTCYRHTSQELALETIQFVPRHDPVKMTRVAITNDSDQPRRLSLFAYQQWVLGDSAAETRRQISLRVDEPRRTMLATNPHRSEFAEHVAFSSAIPLSGVAATTWSMDRQSFLGRHRDVAAPRSLCHDERLAGEEKPTADPCAAWQLQVELAPGATFHCAFLLGEAVSADAVRNLVERYSQLEHVDQALRDVKAFWRDFLSSVEVETPSTAINFLVGGWLPYQNLSCRMWARSAYYQSGGAYGFRDQLQDAAALLFHAPELTRTQIVRHASHQFVEGDVMHWWHPPRSLGLRTRFSDDLLWLPWIAAHYVDSTGDECMWDEAIPFLAAPQLAEGVQEALLEPRDSGTVGSLFEHCCRAIDRSLTRGAHGLPLMGCGDWNDGMNRVGIRGQGESVWLGFFLFLILERFIPLCHERQDDDRGRRYAEFRQQLGESLNQDGWDGEWYRRAFFDDGTPVGSAGNEECQIDALAQAWSLLSGAAPPARAALALRSVERRLVCQHERMIRLLAPSFDQMAHDPGYIKGYLPGIRENGGQYTHGVLWFVQAMAQSGQGTRAVELLEMLCPILHARTAEEVARYQTEPYVVAADVYGEPPHVGRGGWTWYTGSAGWMSRVVVESIFGLRMQSGTSLRIDPRISRDWPRCELRLRLADRRTRYHLVIENPDRAEQQVTEARLDGQPLLIEAGVATVPLSEDGGTHKVWLRL